MISDKAHRAQELEFTQDVTQCDLRVKGRLPSIGPLLSLTVTVTHHFKTTHYLHSCGQRTVSKEIS